MATPGQTSVDLPIQNLGGRVTQFDPMTLPIGASPFNQDCIYSGQSPDGSGLVAGVATRPGMSPFYAAAFAGNPTVNYLKTFVDSTGAFHLLSLDGLGVMRDETPDPVPPNVPATIGNVVAASIAQSDSLLNREWIAISSTAHPGFGIDIPRQWDGTNFDRVSQSGPGSLAYMTVGDFSIPLTALSRTANIITGTVPLGAVATSLFAGCLINIQGCIDTTFNGQWPVQTWNAGTGVFTAWNAPQQLPLSGIQRAGGTVTATLAISPTFASGGTVIVVNVEDPSYNGIFTTSLVNGNQIEWAQAGNNSTSSGGILFTSSISAATIHQTPANSTGAFTTAPYALIVCPSQAIATQLASQFGSLATATISGSNEADWNNTFSIASVETFSTPQYGNGFYTVAVILLTGGSEQATGGLITGGLANDTTLSANYGNAGLAGNIIAGLYQVSVSYVTREEYITKPAPWTQWYAQGGFQVRITGIPFGPPNITQRIVMFTSVIIPPATTGNFYYFDGSVTTPEASAYPSMVIGDNATTTFVGNFDISTLQEGTESTYLFQALVLGECANFTSYSNRLFAVGERAKIPNFLNMDFDGGFVSAVPSANNQPLGWTGGGADGVYQAGGQGITAPVIWGFGYSILGGVLGGQPYRGWIYQSAYQDYLGAPILSPATHYSIRIRLAQDGNLQAGDFNLIISLTSASTGFSTTISIPSTAVGTSFSEFIENFPAVTPSAIPDDLVLNVYGSVAGTAGGYMYLDCFEVFQTDLPFNRTIARASLAGDPESFLATTGELITGSSTDQSIRCGFTLLDKKLYFVTERGLWVTQDDGQNEPASWDFSQISTTVGTGSVRGVGLGESWAVIAAHDGAYIFWGGEPVKISQEIQPDWNLINWAYDQTIYVVVDTVNKRIHIGAPINGATSPNVEFVCDYSQLANAEGSTAAQDIAAHPQAYYSVYNPTKVVAPGKARKWTLWNITMNSAALTIRSDGSYHLLRGNGTSTGKVYDQLTSQLSDDGVAINYQYQTAYWPQAEDEQVLQLGAGNKHCIYLRGYSYGAGTMTFLMYGAQNQRAKALSNLNLTDPEQWDWEKNVDFRAERMSLLFGTNAVGAWSVTSKLIPTVQKDLSFPIRGSV